MSFSNFFKINWHKSKYIVAIAAFTSAFSNRFEILMSFGRYA